MALGHLTSQLAGVLQPQQARQCVCVCVCVSGYESECVYV